MPLSPILARASLDQNGVSLTNQMRALSTNQIQLRPGAEFELTPLRANWKAIKAEGSSVASYSLSIQDTVKRNGSY